MIIKSFICINIIDSFCDERKNILQFMLVGDELYLNFISTSRQARTASHVFVHPNYNVKGILNDVAVIRVNISNQLMREKKNI